MTTSLLPSMMPTTRCVVARPLGDFLPPLVITYTNDPNAIEQSIHHHISPTVSCIGIDTESKPCFTKEAAKEAARTKKNPDVLQLGLADGNCLVAHLSCLAYKAPRGLTLLQCVLKCSNILKAGVGIIGDALLLHENKGLGVNCRLELAWLDQNDGTDFYPQKPQGTL